MTKIKVEIERFIEEYDRKIEGCEKLLEIAKERIREARKSGDCQAELRKSQSSLFAQYHAYSQAKYDFDSLLDYVAE